MKNSFISSFETTEKYKVKKVHVFTFILLSVFSLTCLEIINRFLIYNMSTKYTSLKYFNTKKEKVELLFLGDSHFLFGIDSTRFGFDTFNLSFRGASFIQSYYILKNYIDEMTSLKLVVLPLDFHSFSSFRSDRIDAPVFWNRFLDYSELLRLKGPGIVRYKFYPTLTDQRLGREFFVTNIIKLIRQKGVGDPVATGRKVRVAPGPLDKDKTLRRVQFHFAGQNVFDKDLLDYFARILNLCKEKNIPVVTLQMPLSRHYLKYAEEYVTDETMERNILQRADFSELIYKDLNYVTSAAHDDNLFATDGDHLDWKGQRIFSDYLAGNISGIIRELNAR